MVSLQDRELLLEFQLLNQRLAEAAKRGGRRNLCLDFSAPRVSGGHELPGDFLLLGVGSARLDARQTRERGLRDVFSVCVNVIKQ